MTVCPLCNHQQAQGAECDNCGRVLTVTKVPDLPTARLPDLELTQLPGGNAPVAAAVMPELERTQLGTGPDLPQASVPDLEMTRATPVHVSVQRIAEFEGHLADREPKTAAPPSDTAGTTCRYCRNVQLTGAMCDRCGMRLPRYAPTRAQAAAAAGVELEVPEVRHSCGARTRPGGPCSSCGVHVPTPDGAS